MNTLPIVEIKSVWGLLKHHRIQPIYPQKVAEMEALISSKSHEEFLKWWASEHPYKNIVRNNALFLGIFAFIAAILLHHSADSRWVQILIMLGFFGGALYLVLLSKIQDKENVWVYEDFFQKAQHTYLGDVPEQFFKDCVYLRYSVYVYSHKQSGANFLAVLNPFDPNSSPYTIDFWFSDAPKLTYRRTGRMPQ